jgi:hypothetical protein
VDDDWRAWKPTYHGIVWGGRYRVCVPWRVDRRDLQRLVRATQLWEAGRQEDARAIWQELRDQGAEPRFSR